MHSKSTTVSRHKKSSKKNYPSSFIKSTPPPSTISVKEEKSKKKLKKHLSIRALKEKNSSSNNHDNVEGNSSINLPTSLSFGSASSRSSLSSSSRSSLSSSSKYNSFFTSSEDLFSSDSSFNQKKGKKRFGISSWGSGQKKGKETYFTSKWSFMLHKVTEQHRIEVNEAYLQWMNSNKQLDEITLQMIFENNIPEESTKIVGSFKGNEEKDPLYKLEKEQEENFSDYMMALTRYNTQWKTKRRTLLQEALKEQRKITKSKSNENESGELNQVLERENIKKEGNKQEYGKKVKKNKVIKNPKFENGKEELFVSKAKEQFSWYDANSNDNKNKEDNDEITEDENEELLISITRGTISVEEEVAKAKKQKGQFVDGKVNYKHTLVKLLSVKYNNNTEKESNNGAQYKYIKELVQLHQIFLSTLSSSKPQLNRILIPLLEVDYDADLFQIRIAFDTTITRPQWNGNGHICSLYDILYKRVEEITLEKALNIALGILHTIELVRLEFQKQYNEEMPWMAITPHTIFVDSLWNISIAPIFPQAICSKNLFESGTDDILYAPPEVLQDTHMSGDWKGGTQATIYSFGILLGELLSSRAPFKGYSIDDVETLKKMIIEEEDRPYVDFSTTSSTCTDSLKSLLKQLWSSNPSERPSFTHIISSNTIQKTILLPFPETTGNNIKHFWKEAFDNETARLRESLPWKVFAKGFVDYCCLKSILPPGTVLQTCPIMLCLKKLLESTENREKNPSGQIVHWKDLKRLTEWHGPIEQNPSFLQKVESVVSIPGFHGFITPKEAKKVFEFGKEGDYIIRYSGSKEGWYGATIVCNGGRRKSIRLCVIKGKISVPSIKHKSWSSLKEFINSIEAKEQLGLNTPLKSQYNELLDVSQHKVCVDDLITTIDGDTVEDDDNPFFLSSSISSSQSQETNEYVSLPVM